MTARPIKWAAVDKHSRHKSEACLCTHAHTLVSVFYLLCRWGWWVPLSIFSTEWRWVQSNDVIFFGRLPDVLLSVAHEHRLLVNQISWGPQPSLVNKCDLEVNKSHFSTCICTFEKLCHTVQDLCVCVAFEMKDLSFSFSLNHNEQIPSCRRNMQVFTSDYCAQNLYLLN